jgi:hypothetical protein
MWSVPAALFLIAFFHRPAQTHGRNVHADRRTAAGTGIDPAPAAS